MPLRELILLAVVAVALLAIVGRMWYLQMALGPEIERLAEDYRTKSIRQLPLRGRILDRTGALIATVKPQDVVALIPADVKKKPQTLYYVASALGIPAERIQKILKTAPNANLPVPVAVGVPPEQVIDLAERSFNHPALRIAENPIRSYPDGVSFSHSVGYVGPASEDDLKRMKGINRNDFVGKLGVERQNETRLHGTAGQDSIEVNAQGDMTSEGPLKRAPDPGDTLVLTLDAKLQRRALELLKDREGAIVAVEPRSGEVLILASSPSYDANLFVQRILPEDWAALSQDRRQPLLNRALQSAYPPGSPFKLVTAIAGLKAGVVGRYSSVVCTGGISLGGRTFRCHKTHGLVDFTRAISLSCDSFFYGVGRRAGEDLLRETALECGIGAPSGIDLPSERRGTVPTDEWLAKRKLHWRGGDTINMSIGQGYLEATAIQMADLAALFANRGIIYRPHLLRKAYDPITEKATCVAKPEVRFRVSLSDSGWDAIIQGMEECISQGTGGNARIPGLVWAGKTGSAEHSRKGSKTHAWFIGYAPLDRPKIAICVMLQNIGHGGDIAAPIARELVQAYLRPAPDEVSLGP